MEKTPTLVKARVRRYEVVGGDEGQVERGDMYSLEFSNCARTAMIAKEGSSAWVVLLTLGIEGRVFSALGSSLWISTSVCTCYEYVEEEGNYSFMISSHFRQKLIKQWYISPH